MKGHRVCADSFLCVLIRESLFMGKGGCISTVRCDFLHSKGVFHKRYGASGRKNCSNMVGCRLSDICVTGSCRRA